MTNEGTSGKTRPLYLWGSKMKKIFRALLCVTELTLY